MKPWVKITIPALSILFLLSVVLSFEKHSSYSFPVSPSDVDSISFYYDNLGKKKIITSPSDVSIVFNSLDEIVFHEEYNRFPTGGQTFFLVFHLSSGKDWICTYYQTNLDTGFYADDTTKLSISNLDLKALWSLLHCPESSAFAAHEISPPSL